jgi:hypothetical protein
MLAHKKLRYVDRLGAADPGERLRDVHVLIGGTGAVAGEALIKLLRVYADLRRLHRVDPDTVGPVLVATGRDTDDAGVKLGEFKRFRQRLWTLAESEYGAQPSISGDTVRMPTGALIVLREFSFAVLPRLGEAIAGDETALPRYVASLTAGARPLAAALLAELGGDAPLTDLLAAIRSEVEQRWVFGTFRSVQLGIPIPSLLAYHLDGIQALRDRQFLGADEAEAVKEGIKQRICDELTMLRAQTDTVLVVHTTAVGGMYDETSGEPRLRLGFAHAAKDSFLADKHRQARTLSELYAKAGIWNLVPAAAIGIDHVRIGGRLEMEKQMRNGLRRAAVEPFVGARAARYVHVHRPAVLPLAQTQAVEPLSFDRMPRGGELRPRVALRSGENGYLSAANAEALYRVMRVASPSELGTVLATVGALGDDPVIPWFPIGADGRRECYYKETDNSRLVLDFLSQPQVRSTQLSGLQPQALVDLGSAKHQAELHTLGLLILLHRLRTLDLDAIPAIVERGREEHGRQGARQRGLRFDAVAFFENHSRPLTFESIQEWDVDILASDLRTLVLADSPAALAPLKRFSARDQDTLNPDRAAARDEVFAAALESVRTITSLGSPVVVDDDGHDAIARCGWWVAPLSIVAETSDSIAGWFRARRAELAEQGATVPLEDLVGHHLATSGFIDLRRHAIVAAEWNDHACAGRVWRATSQAELRGLLQRLKPFQFFASCGLLAILERLRGLADFLQVAQTELGTHFDSAWAMPRDDNGHTLVVPGIVESFRMVSEGLEKGTGTEILDGYWGYSRIAARQGP